MAVGPRSQVALRVVEVKRSNARQPHGPLDVPQQSVVPLPRTEVVARGERMACVDAHREPLGMRTAFHDLRELREGVPDDAALAGGDLEDREDVGSRRVVEGPIQTRGDRLERIGFPLAEVCPRMEDDVPDAEHLRPIQFLHECRAAVAQSVFLRRSEVDQVVRMDDRAGQPMLFHVLLERLGLLGRDWFRLAEHSWAPRKDLNRLAADAPAAGRGEGDALRNRDVSPEIHGVPVRNPTHTDELCRVAAGIIQLCTGPSCGGPSRSSTTG